MELFTILLSGLLGLIAPVGLVVDRTAENAIRAQFAKVEQLQVRVENTPSYQLLQGKVGRVRIAGRSLQLKKQDLSIAVLELETDAIELASLKRRQRQNKVIQPLQAGVRVVFTQEDINKLLKSPLFISKLKQLNINSVAFLNNQKYSVYNLANPNVSILANNRLLIQVELQNEGKGKIAVRVESGFGVIGGRSIQLINPVVALNGEEVPPQILQLIVNNINQRLDLRVLEDAGVQMRILKLSMNPNELEIAAFLRIEPSAKFWETLGS